MDPHRARRRATPLVLLGLLLAVACDPGPKGNHTVRVLNAGRSAGASVCSARQFRWINVARVADGFAWSSNIVVDVGQTTDVPFDLPSDGAFALQLGAWVPKSAGEAVWAVEWASVPMAIGGTTEVHLETDDAGYLGHSLADGQPPQSSTVACTNP